MSIDHEPYASGEACEAPTSLDLSGLPASVAAELRNLVATLRASFPATRESTGVPMGESSADWARRLRAWSEGQPPCAHPVDDDRESIYAGRGE
jgi:hypothetical protein